MLNRNAKEKNQEPKTKTHTAESKKHHRRRYVGHTPGLRRLRQEDSQELFQASLSSTGRPYGANLVQLLSHPGDTPWDTPVKVTLPAVAGTIPWAESWTE